MKNFGGILVLISVAYFASLSEAQYSQADNYRPGFFQQNPCVSKQTCSKCLQTPNCAWCMKEVRRKKSNMEKILKGSLDSIPSPSVKIQIMGGKVCLRCKGKTLLGVANKLLMLTSPSNVLPY